MGLTSLAISYHAASQIRCFPRYPGEACGGLSGWGGGEAYEAGGGRLIIMGVTKTRSSSMLVPKFVGE